MSIFATRTFQKSNFWVPFYIGGLAGAAVCLVTIGIYINNGLKFGNEISFDISIVDFFSLFVTILLAVFITNHISARSEAVRVEKDLLIARIAKFSERFVRNAHKVMAGDEDSLVEINHFIKVARINLESLCKLTLKYHLIDKEVVRTIKKQTIRLKDLLTDNPKDDPSGFDVKNTVVSYSTTRRNMIENALNKLEEAAFEMTVEINRA